MQRTMSTPTCIWSLLLCNLGNWTQLLDDPRFPVSWVLLILSNIKFYIDGSIFRRIHVLCTKIPMFWKRWMKFGTDTYPEAQVNTMNAQWHWAPQSLFCLTTHFWWSPNHPGKVIAYFWAIIPSAKWCPISVTIHQGSKCELCVFSVFLSCSSG